MRWKMLPLAGLLAVALAPSRGAAQLVTRVKTLDGGGSVNAAAGAVRLTGSITPHGVPDDSRMVRTTTVLGSAYIPTLAGWVRQSLADPVWLQVAEGALRCQPATALPAGVAAAGAMQEFFKENRNPAA